MFRSAARLTFRRSKSSASAAKKKNSAEDAVLKAYILPIKLSSSEPGPESSKRLLKAFKAPPENPVSSLHAIVNDGFKNGGESDDDDQSGEQLATEASRLLYDWSDSEDKQKWDNALAMPWMSKLSNNIISLGRKEVSRDRKQKWVFKNTQTTRMDRLAQMCANKLGSDVTLEVFGRMGRETGLKEYNGLIKICINKARDATDEEVSLEQIYKAHQIFKSMKETGFKIEEETYGQFLMYLIDCGMVEEFFFFLEIIKDENPDSLPRFAYYEMLLWIKVKDEIKIQELCLSAVADDDKDKSSLQENLLLALCERDCKEEFLALLSTFDITKVTSIKFLVNVFKSLGKLSLEPLAGKLLLDLKSTDIGTENISKFICEYTISIPNLAVEDVIVKFHALHKKFEVLPTSAQFEKLIRYSCESLKVHVALSLADEAFDAGLTLSLEAFHSILVACERSCEFNLVHQINSMLSRHKLKPNNETFRIMIFLCVRMKDFQGAHKVINDLQEMKLTPTASMYNAIMSGYFREKMITNAMNILKQMEEAEVKPDAMTFACLISNSRREKDIDKNYNDLISSEVPPTKQIFMALINAYAGCGQFEKAKQVISDKRIPVRNKSEVKSVLVSALASHGQLSDALQIYEEIKEVDANLEPKAIKCLIEHLQSKGELNKLLQLLKELNESPYWVDACYRVVAYCVQEQDLRSTVGLLKQIKDNFNNDEIAMEVMFDEVFCLIAEKEATDMKFGLDLLQAIKNELHICPSRKCLDFLLSACVTVKDAKSCFVIWKEYETAGLPYNVLSYVRMYQALLASGDRKSARKILGKISKDDPHVCCVVKACQETYLRSPSLKKKHKMQNTALTTTLGLLDGIEIEIENGK